MKTLLLLSCILISIKTYANSSYNILINENGYVLNIDLIFNHYQTLSSIRHALVKSEIISHLSSNVKSVKNTGTINNYESLMDVKSMGIGSQLLSHCTESFTVLSWSRKCTLLTEKLDSGKYMVWKNDQVICTKKNEQETECLFTIKGKTKPLKIFGMQLLTERAFAVKAKAQALNNFFKIYYFIRDQNISTKVALENFEKSKIKIELDQFEIDAMKGLKKDLSYKRSFKFQEL